MRLWVLDTCVLVAAFRSNAGASRYLLEAALGREFKPLLSVPLLLEYEAVLTRPEHLAASGATKQDVAAVLDELASVAMRVALTIRSRPLLTDPNDEMALETAINGAAEGIITLNERHFRGVAEVFGCQVRRPGEAIHELRKDKGAKS